jgi:hypothetical protein
MFGLPSGMSIAEIMKNPTKVLVGMVPNAIKMIDCVGHSVNLNDALAATMANAREALADVITNGKDVTPDKVQLVQNEAEETLQRAVRFGEAFGFEVTVRRKDDGQ